LLDLQQVNHNEYDNETCLDFSQKIFSKPTRVNEFQLLIYY